jgi:DNA-binding NarL/FixJ family response regulator
MFRSSDSDVYKNDPQQTNPLDTPLKIIHKDINKPVYLSKQQKKCFLLLFKGLTAKQIADKMHLSFRTIQHYCERIRDLLGCENNKELIIKYYKQIDSLL